ncbi:hypothetical protein BC830DRAFT_1168715 [Chytriomyces sp. MP71]|nr:hypothetical protein BC830DRAFT_1168715 [Chytriomyces sp. MP71]
MAPPIPGGGLRRSLTAPGSISQDGSHAAGGASLFLPPSFIPFPKNSSGRSTAARPTPVLARSATSVAASGASINKELPPIPTSCAPSSEPTGTGPTSSFVIPALDASLADFSEAEDEVATLFDSSYSFKSIPPTPFYHHIELISPWKRSSSDPLPVDEADPPPPLIRRDPALPRFALDSDTESDSEVGDYSIPDPSPPSERERMPGLTPQPPSRVSAAPFPQARESPSSTMVDPSYKSKLIATVLEFGLLDLGDLQAHLQNQMTTASTTAPSDDNENDTDTATSLTLHRTSMDTTHSIDTLSRASLARKGPQSKLSGGGGPPLVKCFQKCILVDDALVHSATGQYIRLRPRGPRRNPQAPVDAQLEEAKHKWGSLAYHWGFEDVVDFAGVESWFGGDGVGGFQRGARVSVMCEEEDRGMRLRKVAGVSSDGVESVEELVEVQWVAFAGAGNLRELHVVNPVDENVGSGIYQGFSDPLARFYGLSVKSENNGVDVSMPTNEALDSAVSLTENGACDGPEEVGDVLLDLLNRSSVFSPTAKSNLFQVVTFVPRAGYFDPIHELPGYWHDGAVTTFNPARTRGFIDKSTTSTFSLPYISPFSPIVSSARMLRTSSIKSRLSIIDDYTGFSHRSFSTSSLRRLRPDTPLTATSPTELSRSNSVTGRRISQISSDYDDSASIASNFNLRDLIRVPSMSRRNDDSDASSLDRTPHPMSRISDLALNTLGRTKSKLRELKTLSGAYVGRRSDAGTVMRDYQPLTPLPKLELVHLRLVDEIGEGLTISPISSDGDVWDWK